MFNSFLRNFLSKTSFLARDSGAARGTLTPAAELSAENEHLFTEKKQSHDWLERTNDLGLTSILVVL